MEDKDKTKEQLTKELSKMRQRIDELEALERKQKHTEEALRACEARLKEVQQLAHIAQWEVNLQTGEASWSDEDYRILGYEPGEVEPSWDIVLEHIHPDDMHIIEASREKLISEGSVEVEYRIIQRSGQERFIRSENRIEYDSSGNPLFLRGIFQDITERKRVEEEKKKLIADLNKALENNKHN
jgi:PAS domain S-box-containing protein